MSVNTTMTLDEEAVRITAAIMNTAKELPIEPGARVDQLETEMRKHPQLEIEPRHHFAKSLYAREITIPAGALLTGKIHKTEHLNVISRGEIIVWTETEGAKRITAPFTFVAKPGTRRVGFAVTETVWTTVHGTEETNLENLEKELIEPRDAAVTLKEGTPCLGSQ